MEAISSHGTVISRRPASAGLGGAFTPIGEIGDIQMPGLMRNEFDTTSHNQDIDRYQLGILRRDPVTFPIWYNAADATHNATAGLRKAIIDNSFDGYKIVQPDGDIFMFSGRVQALNQTAPVDGVQIVNVTVRPSGSFHLNGVLVGGAL